MAQYFDVPVRFSDVAITYVSDLHRESRRESTEALSIMITQIESSEALLLTT